MDNPVNEISIEEVVVESAQTTSKQDSLISTVSNYVSDFQNWWWLIVVCLIFLFVIIYFFSNKRRINALSKDKLQEFTKNKKYIPLLFVELSNTKELLRYFIYGKKWRKRIISNFNYLYKGKHDFRNYSKQYLKHHRLSYLSSLETIKKTIDDHLSYFSGHEYLKDIPSDFPDYKYTLDINSYWYQETLKNEKKKCEIIKSNFILIKGTAGNGKTNLVCNIVDLLLKLKKRVIFINAKDIQEPFRDYLLSRLNLYYFLKKIASGIYYLFFKCFETYIIVDAINENDAMDFSKQLFSEIDKLLTSKVKIIITCRQEYFEQRFSSLIDGMNKKPYIIDLNYYRDIPAKEKLLERYCKNFNVTKPLPFISEQLFSTSLLLLRLYFEVNEGKTNQDISLYRFKIYQEYIRSLEKKYSKENVEEFIDMISKKMIEKNIFNYISIKEVTNNEQQILFIRAISDDNLLTGRKVIKNENSIAEFSEEVVYFPFDELRDYCLARYLVIKFNKETEEGNDDDAKENLYAFLKSLKKGYLSPLEGILHYLYLHFKANKQIDICKVLLAQDFYNDLWNHAQERLFNSFAISVIMDSEEELEEFELKYIALILLIENRDVDNLFQYLFYQEKNGIINKLNVLLKIIYSYSTYSHLKTVLGCYTSYGYPYYSKNEYIVDCLKLLLFSLRNEKCIECQEYFAIIGILIDDMYTLQGYIELCPNYTSILRNIIQNTKCIELKQKAQNIMDSNIIQTYEKETLIKELEEEVLYYEKN